MEYPIVQYIGRFHPLLVHLPIGILLMAVLLGFLGRREGYAHLRGANHIVLFFGALSATLACVTGYILSFSGDYNTELVGWHQWSALCLAAVSWLAFFVHGRKEVLFKMSLTVMALLLVLTGHLGGSITHGTDFITPPPPAEWLQKQDDPEPLIQLRGETVAYEAVNNIITRKCKSCHGPSRQKGKLRLDVPEHLMAGGENGSVLEEGSAGESTMSRRISLPVEDEDHMPPKEKSQLTEAERKVLVAWIESGASFDKTVAELGWKDSLLLEVNSGYITSSNIDSYDYVPVVKVEEANSTQLKQLEELGVVLLPVSEENNYLSASFIQVREEEIENALKSLALIREQCIELDLAGKSLHQHDLSPLAAFPSLRKLNLANCGLSDDQLNTVGALAELRYLNLVGNQLSLEGVLQLRNLHQLKQLYLFQNNLNPDDQHKLGLVFPSTELNFGGYTLPVVRADTATFNF